MSPEQLEEEMPQRLREEREAGHYTQEQVSAAMEVGVDHYRKMEAGNKSILLSRLQKLKASNKVHMDVNYIAFGERSDQDPCEIDVNIEFNNFMRKNAYRKESMNRVITEYLFRFIPTDNNGK